MYFFEHILDRISKSKYKHNIILKGGLLLSSIIGNDERTTKDMDASLKSIVLEKETVKNIMEEILHIETNDEITYEIIDIKDIRQESEYGGFKLNILAKTQTLKVYLAIEFTTGDIITPREIEYNYNSLFEDRKIPILAYTIETVIAEKFEAIISRSVYNTRMKDFYDIYILLKEKKETINLVNMKEAIKNTFKNRKTNLSIFDINIELKQIKENNDLKELWKKYNLTAPYSNRISFKEIFEPLYFIVKTLNEKP